MREAVSPCDHAGAIGRAQTRLSCQRFRSLTASIEGEENWMNVSLSGFLFYPHEGNSCFSPICFAVSITSLSTSKNLREGTHVSWIIIC
ncbi:hypothetical protein PAHAL_3G338600 [Panicum hallii]|uniref:Uncharacterized protein n=1 Tax=Panicum hallii TaxID=206008 RepID=A0A2S3HDG5_9POAL|nr:hypothetical protein PAHAL_3G338600 [Panicum hallii]